MIWFTSDTHYNHSNIISLSKRPFSNIEEMDNVLIKNLNRHVKSNDTLYHLGDFCYGTDIDKYRDRINCNNIILIMGNHDSNIQNMKNVNCFSKIYYQYEFRFAKKTIFLYHYPLREWPDFFNNSYHLYGHVHNNLPPYKLSIDVGVDAMEYKPININQIFTIMKERPNNVE